MSVAVGNAAAALSGKTLLLAESDATVTGELTFDNDPGTPFVVTPNSSKVDNLDADKLDGVEGAGYAEIGNTETIAAVWTFSAKPAINAGLQFPASQAASADANTLDDYEEGTWTPAIAFGGASTGITYGSQSGHYVKIGKNVWIWGTVQLTDDGSATGAATITGLPFAEGDSLNRAVTFGTSGNFTGLSGVVHGVVNAGASTIALQQSGATGTAAIDQTVFTNTTVFHFAAAYRAAN